MKASNLVSQAGTGNLSILRMASFPHSSLPLREQPALIHRLISGSLINKPSDNSGFHMEKRAFFDSTLLDITGNNGKNARLRGEMQIPLWETIIVVLLTTNGCCQNYPWAGACSPEGSLRRAKENVRPEPASKDATTAS